MSSKKSVQPLTLKIQPSLQLAMFLLLTHAGAIMIISQLTLPAEIILLLSGCVVYSLVSTLQRYVSLSKRQSIVEAVWESDGEWMLLTADGKVLDVELLPNSVMFAALVLLHFRLRKQGRGRTLILPTDSLDKTTFRKLRIRLQQEPPGRKDRK